MRILMITDFLPYPPTSGNPLRTYNLLRRLARANDIWVASLIQSAGEAEAVQRLREFCCGVETAVLGPRGALAQPGQALRYLLAGKPPELRLYRSQELAEKIRRLAGEVAFDVVEIEDSVMATYREDLPESLRSKTVLTFHDVVFNKFQRIARLEPKPGRKLRLGWFAAGMRTWEPAAAERFARCITVSEADRRLLLSANPRLTIDVAPNGVDTTLYQPLDLPPAESPALLFVGNMDYRPNVDAITWFCREALPQVRRHVAGLELWIVGVNPAAEVRRLEGPGVHVTGGVADLRPYYQRCTACIVPLRAGGGTRLKILEAMALGRPVVSTAIGCEGLDVADGRHLFIADSPADFAEKCIRLLEDRSMRERMAGAARRRVTERYDWDAIARQVQQTYREVSV
jgi:polysaccharide biosynthesis protein PslH